MTIGPDLGEVARVDAAFVAFAGEAGMPEGVRRSAQVVLDELLTNTVTYGKIREATVEAELGDGRLCLVLTDDGTAFDPFVQIAPDTTLSIDLRRIGGLGIHLVKQMMDRVAYERRDDRNVVTVEKQLA